MVKLRELKDSGRFIADKVAIEERGNFCVFAYLCSARGNELFSCFLCVWKHIIFGYGNE